MGTDESGHTGDGARASASGAHQRDSSELLDDLLTALAAQIDAVAGWLRTDGFAGAAAGAPAGVGTFVRDGLGADVVGEITSLIREFGDLLARLIAALIAVLEAVVRALRSVPTEAPPPHRRYQPIQVQLDVSRPDDLATRPRPSSIPDSPEGEK